MREQLVLASLSLFLTTLALTAALPLCNGGGLRPHLPLRHAAVLCGPTAEGAALAALSVLEQQRSTGAPLDMLLQRHVHASRIQQDERALIRSHLEHVVRCQGRLDSRLQSAGVAPTPRSRLIASTKLCAGQVTPALPLTTAEVAWLDGMEAPLEGPAMDLASRLECPGWALPRFQATFDKNSTVERELRALQCAAPLDLRVNTLKASRGEALAAIRAAGLGAEPTPYSPVGIRLEASAMALGQIPGLLEGTVDPQDEGSQLVALLLCAQPG